MLLQDTEEYLDLLSDDEWQPIKVKTKTKKNEKRPEDYLKSEEKVRNYKEKARQKNELKYTNH